MATPDIVGKLDGGDTSWTAVSYQNSWVDFGSTYSHVGYRRDALGFVHLRGLMAAGTVGATAFVLPAGYRPAGDATFAVDANGAFGGVLIAASTGALQLFVGSHTYVSLNGITFFAEN